jgi:hypothetical protein
MWVGLHFGRFFHELIWSPWVQLSQLSKNFEYVIRLYKFFSNLKCKSHLGLSLTLTVTRLACPYLSIYNYMYLLLYTHLCSKIKSCEFERCAVFRNNRVGQILQTDRSKIGHRSATVRIPLCRVRLSLCNHWNNA